jgi:HD-GYP domain-containing protein (c-di-GMP phosphodiesterase class II)
MDHEQAVAELERCAGTQFDPAIVKAFAELSRAAGVDEVNGRKERRLLFNRPSFEA